jgi:hypothetical protein
MPKPTIVIHMFNDHRDGIEGLNPKITYEPPPRIIGLVQDTFIHFTLSWNRDQNRCGPFKVKLNELTDGENHFDLIVHPDLPVPFHPALSRIFHNFVGLRPWEDGKRSPENITFWAEYDEPKVVVGVNTPYNL